MICIFYDIFEQLCFKKGEKPSRVAVNNGISRTSVTRWKNGAIPNSEILSQLSCYFGVTVDFLLGAKDELICPGNTIAINEELLKEKDEINLVQGFRHLNNEGKQRMLQQLDDLLNIEKYTVDIDNGIQRKAV